MAILWGIEPQYPARQAGIIATIWQDHCDDGPRALGISGVQCFIPMLMNMHMANIIAMCLGDSMITSSHKQQLMLLSYSTKTNYVS